MFASCALEIDDLRAALAWAFGSGGDLSIGVYLVAESGPLWISMSLLAECHDLDPMSVGAGITAHSRHSTRERSGIGAEARRPVASSGA